MQLLNGELGPWVWFLCAEILWITMFIIANLYDTRATLSRFEEILKIIPLVYFSGVLFISGHVMNYYVITVNIKQVLVYGFTFSGFLIIGRIIVHTIQKLLLRKNIGLKKAIILGVNRRGLDVYNKLQGTYHHGLAIAGFVRANDDPIYPDETIIPGKILGYENTMNDVIREKKVDDVIIALDKPAPERIMETIMNVNGNPVAMKILPDMYEVVTGLARTDQLVGIPLIDVNLNLDTFYSKHLKRIMDIVISVPAIIVMFPFWILIAIAIKLNSSITDLIPIKFPCRPWAIIMIPIPINNAQEFFIILIMIRCKYSFLKELQRDNEKNYVFFKAKKE